MSYPTSVQSRLGYDSQFLKELGEEGLNLDFFSEFVDGSHHLGLFDGVGADNTTGSGDAGASPENVSARDHYYEDPAIVEEEVKREIWVAAYERWLKKQKKPD